MKISRTYSIGGKNSLPYEGARGKSLDFVNDCLEVILMDGRALRVPLHWYLRLERATDRQRRNFRWIGKGIGIHWPDIDEDLSIEGLLKGIKAPQSKVYLTGKWPEHIERERKRIEASYRTKKTIPSKRASRAVHVLSRSKSER